MQHGDDDGETLAEAELDGFQADDRSSWNRLSGLAFAWALAISVALAVQCAQGDRRQEKRLRLEHFNGWQFIMCCVIIWHHYCNPSIFAELAYCSVTFFVFFSGFVTEYAYADKMSGVKAHLRSFYLRRIVRVLPMYYGIHFLVLVSSGKSLATDFQDSVLMLCTWHGSSPATNFPAWTVCALVWCWLFAPLASRILFHMRQRFGSGAKYPLALWTCLLTLGLCDEVWSRLVFQQDEDMDLDYWFYETKHNVFIFCLGMGVAEVARHMPDAPHLAWLWPVCCDVTLLATLVLTASWNGAAPSWGSSYWSGSLAPVAVWVLTSTLGHQSLLNRVLSHRILHTLGEYSMQIYLLANPLHDLLPEEIEPILLYAFIIALSVAAADLVEHRWSEFLKKATDRLQRGASGPTVDLEDGILLAERAKP
ncbi:unnamed protein product [Symbiodinium natans]|uniref:Acyltransferase 3 domain-containing protein n=1 Tax=Symbiodinium natans TaxID=878477 RepID=A0A812N624_9DINO|nr:unnamed protein product [Symbiodinium natans]